MIKKNPISIAEKNSKKSRDIKKLPQLDEGIPRLLQIRACTCLPSHVSLQPYGS